MEFFHDVNSGDVLELRQSVENKEFFLAFKRMFDIAVSTFLIIFFSPLMVFLAIMIKLTSKGPILFKQIRVGHYGQEFVMYKFRSMEQNSDKDYTNIKNEIINGTFVKQNGDPRITKFGKYLRQTSLDELPQFFNVLMGDMSLVGPRPSEITLCGNEYQRSIRTIVKPGMTGLWQIKNRAHSTLGEMINYDIEYIENIGFWMDLYIILRTIPAVILADGAY